MNHPTARLFSGRAFIALVMAVGFLLLALSGLILFGAPSCGAARQAGWTILGLSKEQWTAVHLNSAVVFIAVGIWHIVYNLKPLLAYLGQRARAARRLRWEPVYALLLGLLLVLGPASNMPPFAQIVALGNTLAGSWNIAGAGTCDGSEGAAVAAAATPAAEPTETHGQGWGRMTLAELCAAEGLDLAAARARLAERGLDSAPEQLVRPIADSLGVTPAEVADALR